MTASPGEPLEEPLEAQIIPLRRSQPPADIPQPDRGEQSDQSFEVDLDEPDDMPPAQHRPVYVDAVSVESDTLPIIPAALRTVGNIKATARRTAARQAHIAGFHAVRLPVYVPLSLFWSVVGVFRLTGRQLSWWWVAEQHPLRQEAAKTGDAAAWLKLDKRAREARLTRGMVLAGEAVAVIVGVSLMAAVAPLWAQLLAVMLAVPALAHVGRPNNKPIVGSAVVAPRFRKLNSDIVLRAYYAAGLGHPDKGGQQIEFGSVMARDAKGLGSQVVIDMPYGTTFADAVKARPKIASGLDVTEQQVFLTRDKTSTRRHMLYVADRDPLAIPAGATPLLSLKPTDIWQPAPFGLDERGRRVALLLLWVSILIGAQPRKGKTFAARLLALYAALDPFVKLTVVDGKDSPDWKPFRLVAHAMIAGTVPNRDGDPIEQLLFSLREIKKHIQQVNAFLSKLDLKECPEGKLTRELSRKYPQLRVWVLVMEEFQVYYELDDQDVNKEVAGLLSYIMAVGPSAGVIILSSSQKPSGVGAGDVQRLFNRYRDNHAVRFALKCGNRIVSEAVLGGDAYSEGFDASSLPVGPEYRGVGYLYGLSDETPTVRTYLATGEDAEKILVAARRHREAAGTLTGMAAGEDITRQFRDVLADVRDVYYAGEAWISWPQIAARLAERWPEHYADLTAEAISAQVRSFKVPSVNGRVDGQVLKGAKVAEVETAMERRTLDSGGS